MSALVAALFVWLGVATVYRWLALRAVDQRLRGGDRLEDPVPPGGEVVALRPLKGAGDRLVDCLESLWKASAGTHTRVVLGVADENDPAVAVVRRALELRPRPPTELRIDPGPPGLNRKMANLIQMTEGLPGDFLLFSDADVRVPEDYVACATRAFKESEVGLVTFPYRSVPGRTLASRIDALITNTHFLPSVCIALQMEGLHFGLGASIAVRREALEKAGGLEALLPVCGDDFYMGRNIEDAGYRLELAPFTLEHVLEDRGWWAAARRHVRWARVVRGERPLGYQGQGVTHGCIPALALGALGSFWGAGLAGWLLPLAWWGLQLAGLWRRRRVLALRVADLPLLPLADVSAFLVHVGGLFGRPRPS